MREAARALDDVSDHLGEVLRRADELLAEWSQFGAQVRAQVESEVAAIGEVVDGAVARAAGAGIDRAVVDRLRALTVELERLEQRTRAASRAVVEQRKADRRVLWIVVAGIVLANALLVVLVLRKPAPAPVAEPVRIESTAVPPASPASPAEGAAGAGSSDAPAASTGSAGASAQQPSAPSAGSNAAASGATGGGATGAGGPGASTPATGAGASSAGAPSTGAGTPSTGAAAPGTGSNAAGTMGTPPAPPPAKAAPRGAGRQSGAPAGSTRPTLSPIALPPKGNARTHKKLP